MFGAPDHLSEDSVRPAIVERDQRRANEVRRQIARCEGNIQASHFDLAEYLAETHEKSFWADWGFESLDDFFKNPTSGLDISPRQCWYLIKINNTAKQLGIHKDRLIAARVSKCKEIFGLDPEKHRDDIVRLVDAAPNTTLEKVKAEVKALKGISEDEEFTWMNIHIQRSAKEDTVQRAFDLCRALNGTVPDDVTGAEKEISDGRALELICASFLADPNNFSDELGEAGQFQDSTEVVNEATVDEEFAGMATAESYQREALKIANEW